MDIQGNYPYFESNQVLTHSQLNELFNYLDQQNRLTRSKLIGIGIVCGLDVIAPAEGSAETFPIKITPGIGITSEGYLVVFQEFFASYYRAYSLPDGVHYGPFEYEDSGSDEVLQYSLTELITSDDYVESTDTALDASFLDDKVVIVFLEMYDYDPRTCLVRSCDEIGQTRYIKTRVLVASREIAESIREETGLIPSTEDIFPERFDFPEISIKRVKLTPEEFDSPGDIYSIVLDKYRNSVSEIYEELIEAIKLTYTTYQPILLPLYTENPFETTAVENLFNTTWNNYIQNATPSQSYIGMQYFYDFIKDLILAYDEFRIAAFDIVRKCNIDMSLFPRHLFLGEAYPGDASGNNPEDNRNGFIQPFIYKDLEANIDKAKSLHQRIVEMITGFNLDFISNPENGLSLKLTPSDEKKSVLSKRAIPFYYNIANSESELLINWNYELARRNQANQNLSFHASQYSDLGHVINPLDYNFDKYSFLRIEGNSGAASNVVLTNLQALKEGNNLPFDIKLFSLNETPGNIEISDINSWKDLQTEYISLRDSSICELQKLVKNLKTPEGNEFSTEFDDLDTQITDLYPEILEAIPYNLNSFELEAFNERVNGLFDNLIDYNLYIKYLFGKLLHESYHIITPQEFHEQTQILNGTFHLIRHFMSNCIVYRLITLYYRFQYRMGYLQENSLELFPNFLKEHPGIEHDAGVSKGGTYIMLHDEVTVSTGNEKRIIADFALPYTCCSQNQQIPLPEEEADNLNLPPVAVADYYDVCIGDSEVPLDILNNDLIRDANNLEISTESATTGGGTVVQGEDGVIRYTPPEEISDTDYLIDSFNYTVRQASGGEEDSASVKVLVRPPYKVQPKAIDDIEFTDIDTEITIDVLKNDYYNSDIRLQLELPNSTLGALLSIETKTIEEEERQVIQYNPSIAGRDYFKYRLVDVADETEVLSEGKVRVFVASTEGVGDYEIIQKNSVNNQFNVLKENELEFDTYELFIIDSDDNTVTEADTPHGRVIVSEDEGKKIILYTPNTGYFGSDIFEYQIVTEEGYYRRGIVNLLVICCCLDIPDSESEVTPGKEYKINLNKFSNVYSGIRFNSLGQFNRDIVKAGISDSILTFIPGDDIVYAGKYSFEYFAIDDNKNCYKGKIILTPNTFNVELPDINVHLTTLNPIAIPVEVAEKYQWKIENFDQLNESLGELSIINNSTFQYIPAGGIENVLVATFNYVLVGPDNHKLKGKVNLINLISRFSLPYTKYRQISKLIPKESKHNSFIGFSVDISDQFAIVGAYGWTNEEATNNGIAFVYTKNEEGLWEQQFNLLSENIQKDNRFGFSVAISNILENEVYALVGAPGNNLVDQKGGAVFSFKYDKLKKVWELPVLIKAQDSESNDNFGNAIALYNEIAVLGAYTKDINGRNKGCAYVFRLKDNVWEPIQRLQASDGRADDNFGRSVSIYGSTIVVGAHAEDSAAINAGSCYIFERESDGKKWKEVQKILPQIPETYEYFGVSMAIYGDWIVVGLFGKDVGGTNAGNASVYRRDNANNNWKLFQTLQPGDIETGDRFGVSVAIENETIIVGSYLEDIDATNTGSAYVFRLENNEWVQKQKIQPEDLSTNKYFGYAIGLRNNQAIIGAYNDEIKEVRAGSAYIFEQIPPEESNNP